ncbi:MAG: ferritin [Lentisphaeria bacterium]|jgi:ferritin
MITPKMAQAINKQINAELASAYLYLAMAAWFKSQNLDGAAKWLEIQAQEEQGHAMKFFHFLGDRGGVVELAALAKPAAKWKSALDAFKVVAAHEAMVTGLINGLMELAVAEKDYAAQEQLQWFVKEQVEEEASAGAIVARLAMVGESKSGLLMMDYKLAKRGQS